MSLRFAGLFALALCAMTPGRAAAAPAPLPAAVPLAALTESGGVFAAPSLAVDPSAPFALFDGAALTPEAVAEGATEGEADEGPSVAEQLQQRARIARVHKWLGIATWGASIATAASGVVQYRNLYGAFDDRDSNPCSTGDAWPNQDACSGTPVGHLATALTTGALYYTTFALSYRMPDPIGLDEGDGESARTLRLHKRLRWMHFAGMAAQMVMGGFVANADSFGLNRTEDYRTLQGIATAHQAIGFFTIATLTYAGTIML